MDGFSALRPFVETDPAEWDRYIRVNLFGVMNCTRAALPSMIDRNGGRIITIVSDAARYGDAFLAPYAAAKAGAAGFCRSIARRSAATTSRSTASPWGPYGRRPRHGQTPTHRRISSTSSNSSRSTSSGGRENPGRRCRSGGIPRRSLGFLDHRPDLSGQWRLFLRPLRDSDCCLASVDGAPETRCHATLLVIGQTTTTTRRGHRKSDHYIFRNQAAIVGIGATEFSKDSGASVFSLAARAVKAAVADAGLEVKNIDGLATFGPNDSVAPNLLAPALGLKSISWYVDQFLGGSVSMSILGQAALAVSVGVAECVVCYRALNGRSGARMNGSGAFVQRPPWYMQFKASTGYIVPAQEIAMAAKAHMLRFGTTSEDLYVAILCRNNAMDNERAMMRKPLTMEDYLESRWIVEPFRLFDCCLETDGAVAVAVVNADRAKDLPHRPVMVRGAAWGGGVNLVNNGHTDLADSPAKLIADRLYGAALGLGRPRSISPSFTTASPTHCSRRLKGIRSAIPARSRPGCWRDRSTGMALYPSTRRGTPVRGIPARDEPRFRGSRTDPRVGGAANRSNAMTPLW